MPVTLPLPKPPLVVSDDEVEQFIRRNYFDGAKRLASSREQPAIVPEYPLGTWKVDSLKLARGHELSLLLEVEPRDLEPSEFSWDNPLGTFNRAKHRDVDQYIAWREAGIPPPPITVVETDRASLRAVNGHRRLLAADALGERILAWVGPMVADPDGSRDSAGRVMLVPLTYEIATGGRWLDNARRVQ